MSHCERLEPFEVVGNAKEKIISSPDGAGPARNRRDDADARLGHCCIVADTLAV